MKHRVSSYGARFVIYLILAMISIMISLSPLMAAMKDPVRIESGLLSGTLARDPSIAVYKGVPYAAPPVGDLRWRPPQPPIPWQGVGKADKFAPLGIADKAKFDFFKRFFLTQDPW